MSLRTLCEEANKSDAPIAEPPKLFKTIMSLVDKVWEHFSVKPNAPRPKIPKPIRKVATAFLRIFGEKGRAS